MERKTLSKIILSVLTTLLIFFTGCKNKSKDSAIHTKGGIIVSGYTPGKPTAEDNILISVIRKGNNDTFQWIINGKKTGIKSTTIKHGLYKRGDTLFCYIYHNSKLAGKIGPIIISNTPPKVKSAVIIPANPRHGTDLHINIESFDADSDDVSYKFKWFVNDKIVSQDSVLSGNMIKGNDVVYASITPYDGFSEGVEVKTPQIKVVNAAPVITSSPPTHLKGGKFIYQVKAEDPDGDPITFSLVNPPKGARIDPNSGILEYTVPPEVLGNIDFTIKASDNHGNYSLQKFSYRIK